MVVIKINILKEMFTFDTRIKHQLILQRTDWQFFMQSNYPLIILPAYTFFLTLQRHERW